MGELIRLSAGLETFQEEDKPIRFHGIAYSGLPSFEASTKRQDPRWRWYVQRYGRLCWELDALSPVALRAAVENHIVDGIDSEYWERCEQVERAERESLMEVMGSWKALISREGRP
jgi:hypothetical protein